mmetsp:Transcript_17853/g.26091  ORF Transcript_17853/g.26091 Transcript_17853/m.26091 type:complete len:235 (+) Transcript_17853:18-722(+)
MGRDKGKFNKRGGRGGGASRFQATSAEEIEQRNSRIADFDDKRAQRRAEAEEEENGGGQDGEVEKEMEDLKIAKEKPKPKANDADAAEPMSRKQREQAERERKAAEYRRRHELGLTDEFKRDMEKLNEVRRRREEAAKRSAAENESSETLELERQLKLEAANRAAAESDSDSDDDDKKKKKKKKKKAEVPKLDKIAIKKMKPAQLKEALKARGCEIQGNAKTLTARLLKFEAER